MNDYLKFILLFPSTMWLTAVVLWGQNWYKPR